ncbi:GntR family transcriptional regulator [Gulosibacter bifidus]|uniref:GntR family transcriptional regulator n=1 Tax=Gulosibacter bifidus TaxID=272239 RepID=A0ABW5RI58_9MICO|nr:GntR family transcriptional regulator [Gulosibacter bifidus]
MEFDTTSPIWLQLVTEFSRRIVTSQWPAGSRIPSVRELAADLNVNPNTIQRALSELERLELCFSERTAGRFVTSNTDRIDTLRTELAQEAADTFITSAKGFGMQPERATQLIRDRWEQIAATASTPPQPQRESK